MKLSTFRVGLCSQFSLSERLSKTLLEGSFHGDCDPERWQWWLTSMTIIISGSMYIYLKVQCMPCIYLTICIPDWPWFLLLLHQPHKWPDNRCNPWFIYSLVGLFLGTGICDYGVGKTKVYGPQHLVGLQTDPKALFSDQSSFLTVTVTVCSWVLPVYSVVRR